MIFHIGKTDRDLPVFNYCPGPVIGTIIHDDKFQRAVTLQFTEGFKQPLQHSFPVIRRDNN
jgi:hypothetical protein